MITTEHHRSDSPPPRGHPVRLLYRRSVRAGIAGWAGLNLAIVALADGHLPFHAEALAQPDTIDAVLKADAMFVEVFGLMVVVHLLTRHRSSPDLSDRAPDRPTARRETVAVLLYAFGAVIGGALLGRALGWHALGFHLDGMVVRTGDTVRPAEAITLATYNLTAYAAIPYCWFRRRYSTEQLSLRSSDRRSDLLVVLVVLAIESTVQLATASSSILDLDAHQIAVGAPLALVLGLASTVLPTMVLVYCILTPRYLKLTGSVPATVILGGITYALLHLFDGWTSYTSPTAALLSVLYLVLFYGGPGMFKTFITVRTANAWTHVWAYHAIAPHTLVDSPLVVKTFHIR